MYGREYHMQLDSTKAYRHVNVLASGDVVCENVKDEKKLILRSGRKLTDRLIYLLKRYQFQYIYVEQREKKSYDVATRKFLKEFFKTVRANNYMNRYAHLFLDEEYSRIVQTLLAAYLQDETLHEAMFELSRHQQSFSIAVDIFTLATLLAKKVEVERLGDLAIGYLFANRFEQSHRTLQYFEQYDLEHLTYLLDANGEEPPIEVQILQIVQTYVDVTRENPTRQLYEIYHEMHESGHYSNELLYHFRQLLEGQQKEMRVIERENDFMLLHNQALPMRTSITLCKLGMKAETLITLLQYFMHDDKEKAAQLMDELLINHPKEQWMTQLALPLLQLIEAAVYPTTVYQYYTQFVQLMLQHLRMMPNQEVMLLIIRGKLAHPEIVPLFEGLLRSCHFDVYRPPLVQTKEEIQRMIEHYEARQVITIGPAVDISYDVVHYHLEESQLEDIVARLAGEVLRDFVVKEQLRIYERQ